jgi:hypothetical protein
MAVSAGIQGQKHGEKYVDGLQASKIIELCMSEMSNRFKILGTFMIKFCSQS